MGYRKLQAQVLVKTWVQGKWAKSPSLRWTILVNFFFRNIVIFVTFVGDYTIKFSKQFEKENTPTVKATKTLVFPLYYM